MPVGLDIAISLDGNLEARLAAMVQAGEDLTEPMGEIAGYLLGQIQLRFKTGTAPDGVPWEKSQRVIEHGGQTLVEKRDLLGSMREDHGRDYAAAGPEASGGAAIYAGVHQTGFDGPVVVPFHTRRVTEAFGKKLAEPVQAFVSNHVRQMRLPARPYLGFTADDGEEVVAILVDHLGDALVGAVS